MYSDTKRPEEAEDLYKKALAIRTHLAEQHPEAYLQYVAQTQFNISILFAVNKCYEEALSMAQKALETYTTLNNMFDGHFANEIESANQLIEMIKHDNQPSQNQSLIKRIIAFIKRLFYKKQPNE